MYAYLESFAAQKNLQIEQTEDEFQTIPIVDGQPITPEDFNTLPEKVKSEIEENLRSIQSEIESTALEMDKNNLALHAEIEKLMDAYALLAVKKRLDPIRKEFKASEATPILWCPGVDRFVLKSMHDASKSKVVVYVCVNLEHVISSH